MVLLEKYGILFGDNTETITTKFSQYFEKSLQNNDLIWTMAWFVLVKAIYVCNYVFSFDWSCLFADF